jgi:hypothetical protein
MIIRSAKSLGVYKKAYELAMLLHETWQTLVRISYFWDPIGSSIR